MFLSDYAVEVINPLFSAVSILKRPITPPATLGMVDYQSTDHEQLMKRLRPAQSVEEVILKSCYLLFFLDDYDVYCCCGIPFFKITH